MHAIFEINSLRRTPKYQQIINSVTKAIKLGNLKKGDRLCSINELSNECSLARDTVQRAYDELEKEKIIEAVKGKGFYISRTDITVRYKVLLVFNRLSDYKQMIYDSFVKTMGKKGSVELRVHHASIRVLQDIVENNLGQYDYYVIMPHFYENSREACRIISKIPAEKLVILDKNIVFPHMPCKAVYQDFENDIYDALKSGLPALCKYEKLLYVHPSSNPHPREIIIGFKKFCMGYQFGFEVLHEFPAAHQVKKGEAYIVIEESDLAYLIRSCAAKKLKVGREVGILSYNDSSIKQMLLGGISVITTDHEKMGETAARLILDERNEKIRIPFKLNLRNSL